MFTFIRKFVFFLVVALGIVLLDIVLCYRTYYIPSINMFVSFKYVPFGHERTPAKIKQKNKDAHTWLRLNYFGKHLIPTRFARPYQESLDWLAMWSPGEIGNAYVVNKETNEINISNNAFSSNPIIDYHSVKMRIIDVPMADDSLFTIDKSAVPIDRINEPFIVIQNTHWLLGYHLYSLPDKSIHKAHLWHLLV